MEKLPMCRICLAEHTRLRFILNTHLQEMYETLTLLPLETKDHRPILVCYICCAKLQNCYDLKTRCLQSEELFTQMLNYNMVKRMELQENVNKMRQRIEPIACMSKGDEFQVETDNVPPPEVYNVDIKQEYTEALQTEPEDSTNNFEELNRSATSKDDLDLRIVKKEVERTETKSESDQPPAKKAKSHCATLSSHQTHQSSQGSQNIIIETGHHQDQLNTRHTINVIVNNNKKERQKRYREQNRDKLKQREAERRKRIQYSQSIARPSTSSNTNRIELNNKEIITAQSPSGSEKIQPSSIQRNDQGNELNGIQKKRKRQKRYREQNRDKLKQREAERRRRLQNADVITELSTSPNIEFTEIINDSIIDEISTNSRNVAGLEEMQHVVFEVSQQIGRSQSSANTTEIPFTP